MEQMNLQKRAENVFREPKNVAIGAAGLITVALLSKLLLLIGIAGLLFAVWQYKKTDARRNKQ